MRLSVIAALVASTLVAPLAFAQEGAETTGRTKYLYAPQTQSTTVLTPTVGLTMNQLSTSFGSTSNDVGFTAGMAVDMGSSSTVFHTGALITQYNTKITSSLAAGEAKLSNLYLAVPAQGKTFFEGGQDGLFARYGVNVNILMSSKGTSSDGESGDAKSDQNILDLQGAIGLGYAVSSDRGLVLDVSFNRSLMSIARQSVTGIYNQTLMFNAGISL